MLNFNNIWNRIIANEGNLFHTINGKEFKYKINGSTLITNRTSRHITQKNIEKAFNLLPLKGPGEINNTVQGPSYVWAILNDKRIKN
jgi:hypothetical protein